MLNFVKYNLRFRIHCILPYLPSYLVLLIRFYFHIFYRPIHHPYNQNHIQSYLVTSSSKNEWVLYINKTSKLHDLLITTLKPDGACITSVITV